MNTSLKLMGTFFLFVYLLLNYYIGLRSLQALRYFLPSLSGFLFWPLLLVLALSYLADRIFRLNSSFLQLIGSFWLAFFFYLLVIYLAIDCAGFLISVLKAKPTLSQYWQNKLVYLLGLGLAAIIILCGTYWARSPHVAHYNLDIAKQPAGLENLKIVLISDLHIEPHLNADYLEKAAERITALEPDLIMIAGDLVEGTIDEPSAEKLSAVITNLKAKYGIYACLGNHEYYGGQADEITEFLKNLGVVVLRDEIVSAIEDKVYIAGRNDYGARHAIKEKRKPLTEILSGVDTAKPIILLDHQPQAVREAQEAGVDLMLSGHTHGGQLFPADLVTRSLFLIDRGWWQENNFNLIVSTGLGYWGPPIRTSSRSEIVEIELNFTPNKAPSEINTKS
ncbi:MAG TPA: metallophosphoesterase [Peptococcaceae bacterium]|nr:metallophosphoesterase [Peptococcaceae bacterium]